MKTRIRTIAVLGLPAVVACCSLPSPPVATASTISPLPPSNYTVHSVCAAPAPGYASCLALALVPRTTEALARTHPLGITRNGPIRALSPQAGDYGLRPQDLHSAYQLPTTASGEQTIALVDAYNNPTAEADLKAYDEEFHLPACTAANGCFRQVNQNGNGEAANLPFPKTTLELEAAQIIPSKQQEVEEAEGWGLEISLDIETAHATCQNCRILLVEANSAVYPNLEAAEEAAVGLSATEISNSWGGPEVGADSNAFNHPGVVITAAAGDNGYLNWAAEKAEERGSPDYPASSPHVVAVGGTRPTLSAESTWIGETTWNDGGTNKKGEIEGAGAGGSGCSVSFTAPSWQQSVAGWSAVGCSSRRAVADVSADADPYKGVAVHSTSHECESEYEEGGVKHVDHWCTIGGTSLASPLIASVFALAGGAHGVAYPARTLYENEVASPSSLHDVAFGSNGECLKPFNGKTGASGCTSAEETAASHCSNTLICLAGPGYDGPTGVGTPNGIAAFQPPLATEGEKQIKSEGEKGPVSGPTAPPPAAVTPISVTPPGVGASPGTTTPSSPGLAARPTIRLSALSLTPTALIALSRLRPKTSSVGFAFTLSAAARVRATLARRVRVRGHNRWRLVPGALTFTAIKGPNRRHLTNHNALIPGRYRLTLTPPHGSPRSIVFQVA